MSHTHQAPWSSNDWEPYAEKHMKNGLAQTVVRHIVPYTEQKYALLEDILN